MIIKQYFRKFIESEKLEVINENRINIGMTCSLEYLYKSLVCFVSVLEKISKDVNFVILSTQKISEKETQNIIYILNKLSKVSIDFYFIHIESSNLVVNKDNEYWTIDSYLRLFFCHKYFFNLEKIIFLDCDMVVNFDLKKLWNKRNKKTLIAVKDFNLIKMCKQKTMTHTTIQQIVSAIGMKDFLWSEYFEKYLHLNFNTYINAGLFILNIHKSHSEKKWEQISTLLESKKFIFMDQCILNKVFDKDKTFINKYYNFFPIYNLNFFFNFHKKKIIHYAGSPKPWNIEYKNFYLEWKKFIKVLKKIQSVFDKSKPILDFFYKDHEMLIDIFEKNKTINCFIYFLKKTKTFNLIRKISKGLKIWKK